MDLVDHQNVKTSLSAMRHGPTTWNLEKRIQGNVETDIVDTEIESYFERINASQLPLPDVIVVSSLKRTTQTAKALIKYMHWPDLNIHVDARLNERKWGVFEGVPISEASELFQNDKDIRAKFPNVKNWDEDGFKVSGGESIDEVRSRAKQAVREINNNFGGKTILFILHAGTLVSLGMDYQKITSGKIASNGEMLINTV